MLRLGTRADPSFLAEMLYEAAYWRDTAEERPSLEALLEQPLYSRYVRDWGRDGDVAVVAFARTDEPVGAAWCRTFTAAEPGFGYVADDVPELSIACYPEFRGQGVGSLLLGALLVRMRALGARAVCLSVEGDNPARRLYARFGFEVTAEHDDTFTMVARLVGDGESTA